MAQPIYKLFLARPSAAWYRLSQEEQTTLLGKVGETLERLAESRLLPAIQVGPRSKRPSGGSSNIPTSTRSKSNPNC